MSSITATVGHHDTFSTQLPSQEEAALAKLSSRELAAYVEASAVSQKITFTHPNGEHHQIEIPATALRLLVNVLTELGDGNTVKMVPVHAEMTTQEASDMLNMSRPTFIKLLDGNVIPYHRSGNRRKVQYSDVIAYKEVIDNKRLEALQELTELDQSVIFNYS